MYRLLLTVFSALLCSAVAHADGTIPQPAPMVEEPAVTAMTMGLRGELILATADGRVCALRRNGERLVLAAGLRDISCLALSPRGTIYAGSTVHGTVTRLDRRGQAEAVAVGLSGLRGLSADRDETLFVLDGAEGTIVRLDESGGTRVVRPSGAGTLGPDSP